MMWAPSASASFSALREYFVMSAFTTESESDLSGLRQDCPLLSQDGPGEDRGELNHLSPAGLAGSVAQGDVRNLMGEDADELTLIVGLVEQPGMDEDRDRRAVRRR